MTILVLEASKLSPSLIFSIVRIELFLEFPLELVLCVDGIRSSPDVITPITPSNKDYILKGDSDITYLLCVILDLYCLELCFESLKEIVDLPCTFKPAEGMRPWCISLLRGGYLDDSTVGHCGHAHLDLSLQSLDPQGQPCKPRPWPCKLGVRNHWLPPMLKGHGSPS